MAAEVGTRRRWLSRREPEARSRTNGSSAQALTAAATRIGEKTEKDAATARAKRAEAWQEATFEYLGEIPEVRYVARYMGDAFSRLRLFVGIRSAPNADPTPLDPEGDAKLGYSAEEAKTVMGILADLDSPEGGQSEIQRRFGVQLSLPGEAYLVGRPLREDSDEQRWDVYSIRELRVDEGTKRENSEGFLVPTLSLVRRGATSGGTELPADAVAIRIWRPDAEFSQDADSPMRSAMGILDELIVLTKAVRGAALSRVAGRGMMFLPSSMRTGSTSDTTGENQGQAAAEDQVVTDLITVAATAISDPASAAGQVPLIQWMPDEIWKEMSSDKLVQWSHEVDAVAAEQRGEIIRRFATAIDLPAEVLTGMGDVKFWNLQYIGEEGFKAHIEPAVIIMDSGLTTAYLHPLAEMQGVENVERFVIWHDATRLIANPDKASISQEAHRDMVISDARRRADTGYSDEDAPDADEIRRRVVIEAARSGRAQPALESGTPASGPERMAIVASASDHFDGLVEQLAQMDTGLSLAVQQRADAAMHRALERANARLRSLAAKDPATRPILDRVPAQSLMVAPTLGPAIVAQLAEDEDLLVGAFAFADWYHGRVQRVSDETLLLAQKYGTLSDAEAETLRQSFEAERHESWSILAAALLALAGTLLFRPEPEGPPGEVDGALVSRGTVRGALARAGGGGTHAVSMLSGDLVGTTWTQAGVIFGDWQWRYGDAALRVSSFEPHRRLDGVRFAGPDADVLGNSTGWPHVSHFWPSDHKGCLCSVFRTAPALAPRPAVPSLAGGRP